MFLDPSVNNCGFAVYNVGYFECDLGYRSKLLDFGVIKSSYKEATSVKIRQVLRMSNDIFSNHTCSHIVIEVPPQTIYGIDTMTPDMIVARAQSVFKTVAISHVLYHDSISRGRSAMMVLPVQWEPGKSERGGLAIKEYNVQEANRIIKKNNFSSRLSSGGREENAADAVVMGYRMISAIIQKKQYKED